MLGALLCHAAPCRDQRHHTHSRVTTQGVPGGGTGVGGPPWAPYLGAVQEGGDAWPLESRALTGAGSGGGVLNRSLPASGQ